MAFIHKENFKIYNKSKIGNNFIEDIDSFFEVDDIIAPIISKLNIRGYETSTCCQGHPYRLLEDDIFETKRLTATSNNSEITDRLRRMYGQGVELHHVIPLDSHTSYAFYEVNEARRAYIMFKGGVELPHIPTGWVVNRSYDRFVIEKEFSPACTPIMFFTQLVHVMEDLLTFVEKLPPYTNSPDSKWNYYVGELMGIFPEITDVEIGIIREMYVKGADVSEVMATLANFSSK